MTTPDTTDDLQLDELFEKDAPVAEATPEKEDQGQPRDESGRFASKEKTAEAAQPKQDAPKADTQATQDGDEPGGSRHQVPYHEFKSERQKRQEEARLRAEAEGRATAYERQLQALLQQQRQPAAPQPQNVQPPDPYTEPEQFAQYQQAMLHQKLTETKVSMSQAMMRQQYKDYDQLEAVFAEAANRDPSLWQQLYRHPLPAQFAYEQGKRIKLMNEIGSDPDAYRKSLEEQATQKILGELKAGKIKLDGQPVQQTRFPGTLADQTSASVAQTAHMSDDAMMASVFARR